MLAKRLSNKGRRFTREDVTILLAEHLKTIEKLQQVQKAGKLRSHDSGDCPPTGRQAGKSRGSEHKRLLVKRPGSAVKLRKLSHRRPDSPAAPVSERSERTTRPLPTPKGINSNNQKKSKLLPTVLIKGGNQGNTSSQTTGVTNLAETSEEPGGGKNIDTGALKNIEVRV